MPVENKKKVNHKLNYLFSYQFNLRSELPLKIVFFENKEDDEHIFVFIVFHHICFDGWSSNVFIRDFQIYYDHLVENQNNLNYVNLPLLDIQYKDYSLWQREYLSGERLNSLIEYWLNKLSDYEVLNLRIDSESRPTHFDYTGRDLYFELDEETSMKLKQIAKRLKVSLFSLLLSAFSLMLSSFTNQDDIIIGTPVANRNQHEIENLIGFFINMIVLRVKINNEFTLSDYIKSVSDEVIQSQINQELPFERLVKELKIVKNTSMNPIFQVAFLMDDQFTNKTKQDNSNKFKIEPIYQEESSFAKYDLTASINKSDNIILII